MAERKSYLLRLPPELYRELERWARDDLRSVNAQIEFLLRRALQGRRKAVPLANESQPEPGAAAADGPEPPSPQA